MSITHDEYRRARAIAEPGSKLLLQVIRPNQRGRKTLDPLIFLTGMQLSIDKYNVATLTSIHSVLTKDLMLEDQLNLGTRKFLPNGKTHIISVSDLYNLTRRISKMTNFSKKRAPLLSQEERHIRREWIDKIVNAILDPTLPPRPAGSHDYALDGTGIWASERSKKAIPKTSPPDVQHEELVPAVDLTKDEEGLLSSIEVSSDAALVKSGRGQHGVSDASIGAKTSKDGKRNYFFGYDVEAMVRVPALSTDGNRVRTEPNLLERLVVIPA